MPLLHPDHVENYWSLRNSQTCGVLRSWGNPKSAWESPGRPEEMPARPSVLEVCFSAALARLMLGSKRRLAAEEAAVCHVSWFFVSWLLSSMWKQGFHPSSADSQALPDVSLEANPLHLESHRLDDKVSLGKVKKGRLWPSSKPLKGNGLQKMVPRVP